MQARPNALTSLRETVSITVCFLAATCLGSAATADDYEVVNETPPVVSERDRVSSTLHWASAVLMRSYAKDTPPDTRFFVCVMFNHCVMRIFVSSVWLREVRAPLHPASVSLFALNIFLAFVSVTFASEIEVNIDKVFPQAIVVNRGDMIRWISPTRQPTVVDGFSGEFRLDVAADTGWSASYRYDVAGTNYYRRYPAASSAAIADRFPVVARAGIVIVRDWANESPAMLINSPIEGNVFNYGEVNREPIPFLATPTGDASAADHVELICNDMLFTTVTNMPYYLPSVRLPLGKHRLVARQVNRDGMSYDSPPVNITVQLISAPIQFVELVSDRTLVMVSWWTPVQPYVMGRNDDVTKLYAIETSSVNFSGVRFWIERAQTNPQAFFSIRQRF